MIIIIWVTSTVMGVAPHLFGLSSLHNTQTCHLTDNLTYQLLSTCFAFYLPLVFMCIIYWKIFQSAKFRIRKKAFNLNTLRSPKNSKRSKAKNENLKIDQNCNFNESKIISDKDEVTNNANIR